MLAVVVGVVAATAAGVLVHRGAPHRSEAVREWLVRILLWAILPFLAFVTIGRLDPSADLAVGLALGVANLAVVGALALLLATRVLRLPRPAVGAMIVGAVLVNTGYLGLPVSKVLLGEDALGPAIVWDTLISSPMLLVVGFAVGAAFGTRAGETPRERVAAFATRNPPLAAVALALVVPDAWIPNALVDVSHALVWPLLVFGFLALGITLGAEPLRGVPRAPVAALVVLRCAVAPALFLALSLAVGGIPDAFRLQAAMPIGVNALVVGHAYGLDLRVIAPAIAVTTTLVVAACSVVAVM